jgi:hypothetical protein
MGMLDGKYWVVFGVGGELLGVTEDESKIQKILSDEYKKDFEERMKEPFPEKFQVRFGLRLKFDLYTLTWDDIPVNSFYAVNVQAL